MIIFVTGGSASGKSEYAGKLAERLSGITALPGREYRDSTAPDRRPLSGNILYIATLADQSPESIRRIERHRQLRKTGSYVVAECFSVPDLQELTGTPASSMQRDRGRSPEKCQEYGVVLFDSLDAFTASVLFGNDRNGDMDGASSFPEAAELAVMLEALEPESGFLIIVSDNLYEDGILYDEATRGYMEYTAAVEKLLAGSAQCVMEVVCGIPLILKGEQHEFLQIDHHHDVSVYEDSASSD